MRPGGETGGTAPIPGSKAALVATGPFGTLPGTVIPESVASGILSLSETPFKEDTAELLTD